MTCTGYTCTRKHHGTVCVQAVRWAACRCTACLLAPTVGHTVRRKTISFAAGLQPLAVAQHDEHDSIFKSRYVKQLSGNR
jgi:hypothetical protein